MTSEINQASIVRASAPVQDVWYIVRYRMGIRKSLHEMTVQELIAEGFEFYRPMVTRRYQPMINGKRSTKLEWCQEPMFHDYMFVRRVRPGIKEINHIFGIEGGPLRGAVKHEMISALRTLEVAGFIHLIKRSRPIGVERINVGDEVETLGGLIKGIVSTIEAGNRVTLLNHFMNGASPVIVSMANVVRTRTAEEIAEAKAVIASEMGKGKAKKANAA